MIPRRYSAKGWGFLMLVAGLGLLPQASHAQAPLLEPFETGTKTTYPVGSVALPSGAWTLDDALLGTAPEDHKNGAQAVRLEGTGSLTMDFFLPDGAATVTVQHALYGTDASSGFELWYQSQSCGCTTWVKVGQTIISTTADVRPATFAVNVPGPIRFALRKVSGGAARLDLDDFAVMPYAAPPAGGYLDNDHLTMGNPSGATTDINQPNNYLMRKPQYAVSYSRDRGKPNWVSWYLAPVWLGSAQRQDDFRPDPDLPANWYHVSASSYVGSGFDRGHNCPSADRTSTVADNSATFLMSNMMPQAPNNNQLAWARLEDYARTLVGQGNELYIICGSYGQGGTGSNGFMTTLDQMRITVPARCWKVIVVLPVGNNDVSRVSTTTRIIAIDSPNQQQSVTTNWGIYRTSVDAIEAATGLDLLSALPAAVQQVVEAQTDNGPTQ